MFIAVVSAFAIVSALGIAGTIHAVATDGYRRQPTREYAAR
jgi:hypothetical protein